MPGPATTGDGSGSEPAAMLRTQHAEATRRAVLAAARSLFGKKGYGQTSVDEIAATARVTKGAVYHHFTGKEALFRDVHAEVIAEAIARAAGVGDRAGPTIDRILAQVNSYLDAALGEEFRRIVLTDGPAVLGLEAENSAGQQAGTKAFRLFIAEAVAHGELADFDSVLLADLILGMTWVGGMLIAQAGDPDTARTKLGHAAGAIPKFGRPVLVIWGDSDDFFPMSGARRLAAEFPDATLVTVPGAKLWVPVDNPQAVSDAIAGFAPAKVA